ncbi:unnamed protein product [Sphagnum jensenii]
MPTRAAQATKPARKGVSNMAETEGIIWGLERALSLVDQSEGDIDFAIFAIKRDIERLKKEAAQEESNDIDSGKVVKSLERIADALELIVKMYSNPPMVFNRPEKFEYPDPTPKIQFEPLRYPKWTSPLQPEYLNIVEVKEKD